MGPVEQKPTRRRGVMAECVISVVLIFSFQESSRPPFSLTSQWKFQIPNLQVGTRIYVSGSMFACRSSFDYNKTIMGPNESKLFMFSYGVGRGLLSSSKSI